MRIALNAQLLSFSASYRQAGISRLIHATLQGLQEIDQDNDYTVFTGHEPIPSGYFSNPRWRTAPSRLPTARRPIRILWEQAIQPWSVASAGAHLLHNLAYVGPLVCSRPQVVTVYDLSFLLFPDVFNTLNRWYLSTMTPISARQARRVIAISESTKRDLVRLAGVAEDRVVVVYPGLEPDIRRVDDPGAVAGFRESKHLPERFILFVGTLEPRKNAAALVKAYTQLRKRDALPHALVLCGSLGWRYDSIYTAIEESGLAGDIILPGYVARDELPLWYSAADVFVYPSVYEGFGLPVLEAMACGTPVITSNVSSLPEVVGDAGLLIDPNDIAGLAGAIDMVVGSPQRQATMSVKGMARAATFTLERMARGTLQAYQQALA